MTMKVLFIGGSGNISTACSRLAVERGIELTHFNRGLRRGDLPPGVRTIHGDVHDRRAMAKVLDSEAFDVVVDWIVFDPVQAAADVEMFAGKIKQYVFISTATVYQKPPQHYIVSEETPLAQSFLGVFAKEDCHRAVSHGGAPATWIPGHHRASLVHLRRHLDPHRLWCRFHHGVSFAPRFAAAGSR
jgi:nucleoside-diphosphate-sugar epimerase